MRRILVLLAIIFTATVVMASPFVVNCDAHQSLNLTLSLLPKQVPITVWVKGTCTEYVRVNGFEGLTLKGYPGARLVEPSADPGTGLAVYPLSIEASRGVTVDGFNIHSGPDPAVGIGRGSVDIRLRNSTIDSDGGWVGIVIYESSQVSLAGITVHNQGFLSVGAYDLSDVHIEDCLFENLAGGGWHTGLAVGSGHVTMHNTTIRNMQFGIDISAGGDVDIWDYNAYYPTGGPIDVVIDNPAQTNLYGVSIDGGGSLNLQGSPNAKLRITNAGQLRGGDTGGVRLSNGSTLNAGPNLEITGSSGQGIYATGNSRVSLAGSLITGSVHGGLVAVNLSTIGVAPPNASKTEVSGNGVDVFCDSRSLITGRLGILYATAQCDNLLDYGSDPTP